MTEANTGRLIVFSGPACSGKSTLARQLASELNAPRLEMDGTRARIMPGAAHTRADRQVAYRAMAFAAELLLGCGATVILDAPYGHAEDRRELAEVTTRTGAPLYLIETRVSPETAARRFRDRDPLHPGLDLTEDRVREIVAEAVYSERGLLLDTEALSPSECLNRIREYLAHCAPAPAARWGA